MPDTRNLLADIPEDLPEEFFESLVSGSAFRLERIVSRGHTTAPDTWFDQAEDEWVLVLQGQATLRFEAEV